MCNRGAEYECNRILDSKRISRARPAFISPTMVVNICSQNRTQQSYTHLQTQRECLEGYTD